MRFLIALLLMISVAKATEIQCIFENEQTRFTVVSYQVKDELKANFCSKDDEHISCFTPAFSFDLKNGLNIKDYLGNTKLSIRQKFNEYNLKHSVVASIDIPKGVGIETRIVIDKDTYVGYCSGDFIKWYTFF